MKLNSAVIDLLSLDPAVTTVSSQAGGCSTASAAKIVTRDGDDGGKEKRFFMKSGSGKDAELMFAGTRDFCMNSRFF